MVYIPGGIKKEFCPGCGAYRWVRKIRLEASQNLGEFGPLCRACAPPKNKPITTGAGKVRLRCARCGKTRWVERRKAGNLCRTCKVATKTPRFTRPRPGRPRKPKRRVVPAWEGRPEGVIERRLLPGGIPYYSLFRRCTACRHPRLEEFMEKQVPALEETRRACEKCHKELPFPKGGQP